MKEIEDDSKREDREVQCDSYLDNLEAADEKDDGALLFPANGMEFLSKSFILNGGMDKINQYQDSTFLILYSILVVFILYVSCTMIDLIRKKLVEKPYMLFVNHYTYYFLKSFKIICEMFRKWIFG